ncbi:MAG: nucleotide sugar dehydrogenase [Armatimonadetes bacterium]|nr:nucleotide sugar dehydrogenase [Armatimonadota bacterium]
MAVLEPNPTNVATLKSKIADKSALVGVVGLGYVGLPFAVEKAKVGFQVVGIEQNPMRADNVNRAENYIGDVHDEELKDVVGKGLIRAECDFGRIAEMDVVVVCVPTPLDKNLAPDLQYVRSVTAEIAKRLRPGQLVSLESTTYPGTCEEVMLPILEAGGLKVERDFFLAHSPERVDPGNKRYSTKNTHKVVGGVGPGSLEVATAFYGMTIQNVIPVSSAKAAELTKVFENTFRAVNIALVNELTLLCDRMGLSVWEVLDAAFTKPFGIMPFYPGPGVGGHCIPLDPHYLEWKARELNFTTRFIGLAGEINRMMPEFTVRKAARVLNEAGIALSKAKVLVLGASYKKDIDDWRESPSIEVMRLLVDEGAKVSYHDPFVPSFSEHGLTLSSVPLDPETMKEYDLVVIATDHSGTDYASVVSSAQRILDTRNATKGLGASNVTLL